MCRCEGVIAESHTVGFPSIRRDPDRRSLNSPATDRAVEKLNSALLLQLRRLDCIEASFGRIWTLNGNANAPFDAEAALEIDVGNPLIDLGYRLVPHGLLLGRGDRLLLDGLIAGDMPLRITSVAERNRVEAFGERRGVDALVAIGVFTFG